MGKTIKEVYGRQGNTPSEEAFQVRKRVVAAVDMVNGNCAGAKTNLDLSNPSYRVNGLAVSTIECYWNEFNSLSKSEQDRFKKTHHADLAKIVENEN